MTTNDPTPNDPDSVKAFLVEPLYRKADATTVEDLQRELETVRADRQLLLNRLAELRLELNEARASLAEVALSLIHI